MQEITSFSPIIHWRNCTWPSWQKKVLFRLKNSVHKMTKVKNTTYSVPLLEENRKYVLKHFPWWTFPLPHPLEKENNHKVKYNTVL